jgi:hypothetical protein
MRDGVLKQGHSRQCPTVLRSVHIPPPSLEHLGASFELL